MGTNAPEKKKEKRRYQIELSGTSLFLWSLGLFVLLAWIFALGVFAGRGLVPGGSEAIAELKAQIAKIQQMVKRDRTELDEIRELQKDAKFAFFDELSAKKDKADAPAKPSPKMPAATPLATEKARTPGPAVTYVVQVASLDAEVKAKDMVSRLIQKGYPAYYYKVFVKGREYFRVRCGTFKTETEAVDANKRLAEKEKLTGFVQEIEGG
jgi:cell division septation protein DedD